MRGSKQFPHDGDGGGECVDKFKIYKKGVPEILDIPLHSCICSVRYIFISYNYVFSSANCNYTCNSVKWNKWAWLHFASIHLRRYQHKNEKKKTHQNVIMVVLIYYSLRYYVLHWYRRKMLLLKMYQWEFITFRVVVTFRVATQVKRRISQFLAYTLFSNSKTYFW